MKSAIAPACVLVVAIAFLAGVAEGAGTINVTFMNRESSGIESPLPNAYIYLQSGSQEPPQERYFKPAAYILGPSGTNGRISASVPEGTYYIRVIRRNPVGELRPLGPPDLGDYTWSQTNTITVTSGSVIDLGTKYASPFGSGPIVISGTVKTSAGNPVVGYYVRADGGGKKHPAQRTDASGRYTLYLKDAGTYYMLVTSCMGPDSNGCPSISGGTVTVNPTDQKTVNIVW